MQVVLHEGRHDTGWRKLHHEPRQLSIRDIVTFVCEREGISLELLRSGQRAYRIVDVRHIARYLSCMLSGKNTPTIGRFFKNDHSTICYSRDRIAMMRQTDLRMDEKLTLYERALMNR